MAGDICKIEIYVKYITLKQVNKYLENYISLSLNVCLVMVLKFYDVRFIRPEFLTAEIFERAV